MLSLDGTSKDLNLQAFIGIPERETILPCINAITLLLYSYMYEYLSSFLFRFEQYGIANMHTPNTVLATEQEGSQISAV